jgi:ethanolamine ammonia-lyase large subunit
MEKEKAEDYLLIPSSVMGTSAWKEVEQRENTLGPDKLLAEILDKKLWNNAEIVWVIKRMIFYYGKKDELLQKAPVSRLFDNMADVLRAFYLLFDRFDPPIDENMRSYICTKMTDATWGINERTRQYLYKIN